MRAQETYGQEEQRLKQLMDDYEKTLSLIDTANHTESFIEKLPREKRAIV